MNFSQLKPQPIDPIIAVFDDFMTNQNPNKVNLSIGLYFDEQGRIDQFNSIRKANLELAYEKPIKSYLPITGSEAYLDSIVKLVYGADNPIVTEQRVASAQTIAATGGLRVVADFCKIHLGSKRIFVTNPTWGNHIEIYKEVGYEVLEFRHYDHDTMAINFDKTYQDLEAKLQTGDLLLLHPICHNPTGSDFTPAQWDKVIELIRDRKALAIFDMAYLGYGEGVQEDAYAVRAASRLLPQFINIFSGSKTFTLYADRIGSVHVICKDHQQAVVVKSVLSKVIRTSFSSPLMHGAQVIDKLLNKPELSAQWLAELGHARERLIYNRELLVSRLQAHGIDYSYILKQHGFFSFLKITPAQVLELRRKFAVYILESGRINFAGITPENVDYIADALAQVLKG